ncbi:MAG: hypothetical protein JJE13_01190 [Thermoleophilia bacterium]|nr:hypothetical protein [Thermoleophilia bacterium]
MPDVTRAMLMPDWFAPSDGTIMTLALYWDEIVIPDSAYRWSPAFREEQLEDDLPAWTPAVLELADAGIVRLLEADLPAEAFMPDSRPPIEDPEGELFLRIGKSEDGRVRFTGTLKAQRGDDGEESEPPDPDLLERNAREYREATASLFADALIARNKRCHDIATSNNLAPMSPSLLSHMSALTDEADAPHMEGALISATVNAFAVGDATSVDQIIEFREKNKRSLQRFRGAMTDLAAAVRQPEVAPEAALSAARDVYLNRVEPDLGALEARLSESRISFLVRSLFGVAALALTPATLPSAAGAAASFGAQTINYKFSREKLLQEHPYSYLHRLGKADFVIPKILAGPDLLSTDVSPRDFVYQQFDALFEVLSEGQNFHLPRYGAVPSSSD